MIEREPSENLSTNESGGDGSGDVRRGLPTSARGLAHLAAGARAGAVRKTLPLCHEFDLGASERRYPAGDGRRDDEVARARIRFTGDIERRVLAGDI